MRVDWTHLRAFLATMEEGSLSAAARALGLTQPTLSRQIDALEDSLKLRLFERAGRGVRPTPAALDMLPYARAMGEGAFGISRIAAGQSQALEGEVTLSASDLYAALVLPPILADLSQDHPGLRLTIVVDNAASDLRRREADIAVRNFAPQEGDLIAQKVRMAEARLYGTPDLVARLGLPKRAEDLGNAPFVEMGAGAPLRTLLAKAGAPVQRCRFPWQSANFVVAWQILRQGLALGLLDARIGDTDPDLVRACPGLAPVPFPVWLVAHRQVQTAPRLRLVWDALARGLR
ncbi:MAG: LysR family transcriptional regulator [Pseudomonadota bacterium]